MKIESTTQYRFNALYWIIFPALLGTCYYLAKTYLGRETTEFLGYTDTQEHQLKIDISAMVDRVNVISGQQVKKGDTLVILSKAEYDHNIEQITNDLRGLDEKKALSISEYKATIQKVQSEAANKKATLTEEINIEQAKLRYTQSILDSTLRSTSNSSMHPSYTRIRALQQELSTLDQSTKDVVVAYQRLIQLEQSNSADASKLMDNKAYLLTSKNRLHIIAPFDGVVGNVNIRAKEYVDRQTDLITFYESSPSMVIGFIHESMSNQLKVGDSLTVVSTLTADQQLRGKIVSKGFRIVEIPERLRKVPQFKTYGMEVYIQLPATNLFLQKELVKIRT
jgi:multidrug resistance efflux pump